MDRMNPLDASFLYFEDGTTHMHIGSCAIFEGPPPPYESMRTMFASKLPLVPRYRQRVRFVPLDLGRPVWVDDPHFNLEYHIRHTALPAPGGMAELDRLMGRLMAQELDRARPLWEMWMVEGLEDGRWAAVSKVHHCMVDGIAGVDLLNLVLDQDPEPPVAVIPDWSPEPEPSSLRLAADAVADLVRSPREQARAVRAALRGPRHAWEQGRDVVSGLRSFGAAMRATPPTSLDGPIGPHRRWTSAQVGLDDVRTIRQALGGTVNDVILAIVTSGFRDLIAGRGEDPDELRLTTLVPVSVRSESARGVFDNRVSAILFDLPVHIADPLERLAAVRAEMDELKRSHEPEAGEAVTALAGAVPPPITAGAMRLGVRLAERVAQRSVNTVVTNVPGPPMRLYAGGRRMLEYLPYVPIAPGVRVGVAILSYEGKLGFGVTGDYDTAPDIAVVASGIERAAAVLVERARAKAARPKRARKAGADAG